MSAKMLKEFFKLETAAGITLILSALFALLIENSPLKNFYGLLLSTPVAIQIGSFLLQKPLLLWINDGLMAIFFLLVGLEIKREVLQGQLSHREQIALPLLAAIGGLVIPASIYCYFNWKDPIAINGWAIPAATDIAFALGALALLGKNIPESLKINLVAIAIIDDLAAIVIIALFYTNSLSLTSLIFAAFAILMLAILNYRRVTRITPYVLIGICLWISVLKSGVHATLAGVLLALFIPLKDLDNNAQSPLVRLEHELHPWVAFLILPLFAFANAGVSLSGFSLENIYHPITLGIIIGLVVGKPVGVIGMTVLGSLTRVSQLPDDIHWLQFIGLALLTGIGFTMSLFIGSLAFTDNANLNAVRIGVIAASFISGLLGYSWLKFFSSKR